MSASIRLLKRWTTAAMAQPAVSGSSITALSRIHNSTLLGPVAANETGDIFILCPTGCHVLWKYSERCLAVAVCEAAVFGPPAEDGSLSIGLVFGEAQGSLKFLHISLSFCSQCASCQPQGTTGACRWSECSASGHSSNLQHPTDHAQHYHRDQISSISIQGSHVLVAGRDGQARVYLWPHPGLPPVLKAQLSSPTTQFELGAFVGSSAVCTIAGDRTVRLWPLTSCTTPCLSEADSQVCFKPSKQITCHDIQPVTSHHFDAILTTGERTGCFHIAWLRGTQCIATHAQAAVALPSSQPRATTAAGQLTASARKAEGFITAIKVFHEAPTASLDTSADSYSSSQPSLDSFVAVAHSDGFVQVFQLPRPSHLEKPAKPIPQMTPVCEFQSNCSTISRLVFVSRFCVWLGSNVGDLELWQFDSQQPTCISDTSEHIMSIIGFAVDQSRSCGWSASEDGTVKLWSLPCLTRSDDAVYAKRASPAAIGARGDQLKPLICAIQHESSTLQSTVLAGMDLLVIWLQLLRFVFTRQLGFAFFAPLWWVCRGALSHEVDLYENYIAFFLQSFAPQGRSGATVALLTAGAGLLGAALHLRSSHFWKVKQSGTGWRQWIELFLAKQVLVTSLLYVVEELIKHIGASFNQALTSWHDWSSCLQTELPAALPDYVQIPGQTVVEWEPIKPYCVEGWLLSGVGEHTLLQFASHVRASAGGFLQGYIAWLPDASTPEGIAALISPSLALICAASLWWSVFCELQRAGVLQSSAGFLPPRLRQLLGASRVQPQPQHAPPIQSPQPSKVHLILGSAAVGVSAMLLLLSQSLIAQVLVAALTLAPTLAIYCWVAFKVAIAGDVHELVFRSTSAQEWTSFRRRPKAIGKANSTAPRNMFSQRSSKSLENLFWLMIMFAVLGCTINALLPRVVYTLQEVQLDCEQNARVNSCGAEGLWETQPINEDSRMEDILVDEFIIVVSQLLNWLGCVAFVVGTLRHPPFYSHCSNVVWIAMLLVLTFTHMNSMAAWVQLVATADASSCLQSALRDSGYLLHVLQILESCVVYPVTFIESCLHGPTLISNIVGTHVSEWLTAFALPLLFALPAYCISILSGAQALHGLQLEGNLKAIFKARSKLWRQKWRHGRMIPFVEVQLLYSDDSDVACGGVYRVMLLSREPSKRPLLCTAGAIDALCTFLQRRLLMSSDRDGALVYAIAALGNLSSAECFAPGKAEQLAELSSSAEEALAAQSLTSCKFWPLPSSSRWRSVAALLGVHPQYLQAWNVAGDWQQMLSQPAPEWQAALMKPSKLPKQPRGGHVIACSPPTPAHEMEFAHLGSLFAFFLLRRPSEASLLRFKLLAAMKNTSASSLPSQAYLQKELHASGASLVLLAELRAIALRHGLRWLGATQPFSELSSSLRRQQELCAGEHTSGTMFSTLLTFLGEEFTVQLQHGAAAAAHPNLISCAWEANCLSPKPLCTPPHLVTAVNILSSSAAIDARDVGIRVQPSPGPGSCSPAAPRQHSSSSYSSPASATGEAQQQSESFSPPSSVLKWVKATVRLLCGANANTRAFTRSQSAQLDEPPVGQLQRSSSTNPLYNPASAIYLLQDIAEMSAACAKQNIELFKSLLGRNASRPLDNFQMLAGGLAESLCLIAQVGVCPATVPNMRSAATITRDSNLDVAASAMSTLKFACYLACDSHSDADHIRDSILQGAHEISLKSHCDLPIDAVLTVPLLSSNGDLAYVMPKLGFAWPGDTSAAGNRAAALDEAVRHTLEAWDDECSFDVSLTPDWRCMTECHTHQLALSARDWLKAGRSGATLLPLYKRREVSGADDTATANSPAWRSVLFVQRATIRLAASRGVLPVAAAALKPQTKRDTPRSMAFQRSACTVLLTLMSESAVRRSAGSLRAVVQAAQEVLWLACSQLPGVSLTVPPFAEHSEHVPHQLVAEVLELCGLLLSDLFVQSLLLDEHSTSEAPSPSMPLPPSLVGVLLAVADAASVAQDCNSLLDFVLQGRRAPLSACSIEGVNAIPSVLRSLLGSKSVPLVQHAAAASPCHTGVEEQRVHWRTRRSSRTGSAGQPRGVAPLFTPASNTRSAALPSENKAPRNRPRSKSPSGMLTRTPTAHTRSARGTKRQRAPPTADPPYQQAASSGKRRRSTRLHTS